MAAAPTLPVVAVGGGGPPATEAAVVESMRQLDAATEANQKEYLAKKKEIEEAILAVLSSRKPVAAPAVPTAARPDFAFLEPVDKLAVAKLDTSYKLERVVGNTRVTGDLMQGLRESYRAKVKAMAEDLASDSLKKRVDDLEKNIKETRAYVATVGARGEATRVAIADQLNRFLLAVKATLDPILGPANNPLQGYTGVDARVQGNPELLVEFFARVLDELRRALSNIPVASALQDEVRLRTQELAAANQELNRIRQLGQATEAERNAAQARAAAAEEALKKLQEGGAQQLAALQQQITELQQQLRVITASRDDFKARAEEASRASAPEVARLTELVRKAESDLNKCREDSATRSAKAAQDLAAAEARISGLERRAQQAESRANSAGESLSQAETDLRRVQSEAEQANKRIEQLSNELAAATRMAGVRDQAELDSRVARATEALRSAALAAQQEAEEAKRQATAAAAETAASNAALLAVRGQLGAAEETARQLQARAEQARKEVERILAEGNAQLEAMRLEYQLRLEQATKANQEALAKANEENRAAVLALEGRLLAERERVNNLEEAERSKYQEERATNQQELAKAAQRTAGHRVYIDRLTKLLQDNGIAVPPRRQVLQEENARRRAPAASGGGEPGPIPPVPAPGPAPEAKNPAGPVVRLEPIPKKPVAKRAPEGEDPARQDESMRGKRGSDNDQGGRESSKIAASDPGNVPRSAGTGSVIKQEESDEDEAPVSSEPGKTLP